MEKEQTGTGEEVPALQEVSGRWWPLVDGCGKACNLLNQEHILLQNGLFL